jgi:hypothetical protein
MKYTWKLECVKARKLLEKELRTSDQDTVNCFISRSLAILPMRANNAKRKTIEKILRSQQISPTNDNVRFFLILCENY